MSQQPPPTTPIIIYGASDHGRVILDILKKTHPNTPILFFDDHPNKANASLNDIPIISDLSLISISQSRFIIGIGNEQARQAIFNKLQNLGAQFINAIHPNSYISETCSLGVGNSIMAGAILNPGVTIKNNCIINTKASIDHDCIIHSHSQVAPGTTLCGRVSIQEQVLVGAGATIIQGLSIGKHSIIGAGAVVINNISEHQKVVGVPAKKTIPRKEKTL